MAGSICRSMVVHGSVLVVSFPCSLFQVDRRMLTRIEQYALTEASYTVVRLMQHFDTLENADPHPGDEPVKLSALTMSHDRGVWIKLGSSEKA